VQEEAEAVATDTLATMLVFEPTPFPFKEVVAMSGYLKNWSIAQGPELVAATISA